MLVKIYRELKTLNYQLNDIRYMLSDLSSTENIASLYQLYSDAHKDIDYEVKDEN